MVDYAGGCVNRRVSARGSINGRRELPQISRSIASDGAACEIIVSDLIIVVPRLSRLASCTCFVHLVPIFADTSPVSSQLALLNLMNQHQVFFCMHLGFDR